MPKSLSMCFHCAYPLFLYPIAEWYVVITPTSYPPIICLSKTLYSLPLYLGGSLVKSLHLVIFFHNKLTETTEPLTISSFDSFNPIQSSVIDMLPIISLTHFSTSSLSILNVFNYLTPNLINIIKQPIINHKFICHIIVCL